MEPSKEIAHLRKEKGLTIKALAELVGTKPKYIGDLERGRKLPGIEVATKLAITFNVPLVVFWPKYKHSIEMEAEKKPVKNCHGFTEAIGLEILNLSTRSFNALYRAKIETVDELLLLPEKELSKIRRLGPASQREIKDKLKLYCPHRTDNDR